MIPIRDEIKSQRVPFVNYTLIAINVIVFLFMFFNQSQIEQIFGSYALIPADVTSSFSLKVFRTFFSSMFMHGGWMHLISNMLYLWIFGDNVEDRLGHLGYLIFYLMGGIVAGLLHIVFNPASTIPTVGASGAIAATLGAYLIFYPSSRVYTIIPFGFFARLSAIPAALVLGLWFVMQFFSGLGSIVAKSGGGGVAYWAHIGGFAYGMLLAHLLKRQIREPVPAPPRWN